MNTNLNDTYTRILGLLEAEEKPTTNLTIVEREARRTQIDQELKAFAAVMAPLKSRFHQLPVLPPMYLVEWADAVLKFYNLVFLCLDTTGVDVDSDIIRIYIAGPTGKTLFDHLIKPTRQQWANTPYTGIAQEQLDAAPSLADVWPFLQAELSGRFVLAFNLPFVQEHLAESAEHYQLPKITLIGSDLQDKARSYWSTYYSPKLTDLCRRLGHELHQPATAPDRVVGQYTLLRAMSLGITDVPGARESVAAGVGGDADEGPF